MKLRSILMWTLGGALFGVAFGAIASIFQGGPDVMRGIQESWWWFGLAGFLMSTIGSGNARTDGSSQTN
jgi:hypothetical protein